jgi:hypothetical protein
MRHVPAHNPARAAFSPHTIASSDGVEHGILTCSSRTRLLDLAVMQWSVLGDAHMADLIWSCGKLMK